MRGPPAPAALAAMTNSPVFSERTSPRNSRAGVAQPSDRVCAKHCAAGLAIMVSLMSYRLAPAAGGTAGAAAPSVQLAPFGYIPVGTPLTKPGALKRWTQPKWLGLPSHPNGFR